MSNKNNQEKFAKLLTEALYKIKLLENKSIDILQDDIGYAIGRDKGGSAIEYWRRGNIPTNLAEVERLGRELVKRMAFNGRQFCEFLAAAGYPEPEPLCQALFPNPEPERPYLLPLGGLPHKKYYQLIGREALLDEILNVLKDGNGRQLLGIAGLGGIGKTALARDVADQCEKEGLFEAYVWMEVPSKGASAVHETPPTQDIADEPPKPSPHAFTFEKVLDEIGTQLGVHDFAKLARAEKEQRVQAMLKYRRVLVVIDNMETAVEPQNDIVRQLAPLMENSRALFTSRHRFLGEVYAINLKGLEPESAMDFIRADAAGKNIEHIRMASSDELRPIAQTAGGSPLALKLIVSQLQRLPADVVLQHLSQVTPNGRLDQETEYTGFYKFVFFHSWRLLQHPDQQLLVSMARFVPANGCHFEAVQFVSAIPSETLYLSIDSLWQFSFLEVGEIASLAQIRYYLHPLTQYFVLSDIVKVL